MAQQLEKVEPKIKKHGGRRPGSGRKAGTPNKTTAELRAAIGAMGDDLVNELMRIAFNAEFDNVRVAAIKELLDRGWGKSPQSIEAEVKGKAPIIVEIRKFSRG